MRCAYCGHKTSDPFVMARHLRRMHHRKDEALQLEQEYIDEHAAWPRHLTVDEFIEIVQNSQTLFDVQKQARITRNAARRFAKIVKPEGNW